MNITESEAPYEITAKTCGCKENGRKVIYSFVESFHNLSKDKKDILISEIHACERLRKYARDEQDKEVIGSEISDLKMALDLLTQTWTIRFTDCKTYDISYLPDRSFESIKTREENNITMEGIGIIETSEAISVGRHDAQKIVYIARKKQRQIQENGNRRACI